MGTIYVLLVALVAASAFFVWERSRPYSIRTTKAWDLAEPSPVSKALTRVIGVGGGIYLSLQLLFTFLEIAVPQQVRLAGLEVDPLATFSLGLAIFQIVGQHLFRWLAAR